MGIGLNESLKIYIFFLFRYWTQINIFVLAIIKEMWKL